MATPPEVPEVALADSTTEDQELQRSAPPEELTVGIPAADEDLPCGGLVRFDTSGAVDSDPDGEKGVVGPSPATPAVRDDDDDDELSEEGEGEKLAAEERPRKGKRPSRTRRELYQKFARTMEEKVLEDLTIDLETLRFKDFIDEDKWLRRRLLKRLEKVRNKALGLWETDEKVGKVKGPRMRRSPVDAARDKAESPDGQDAGDVALDDAKDAALPWKLTWKASPPTLPPPDDDSSLPSRPALSCEPWTSSDTWNNPGGTMEAPAPGWVWMSL